MVLCCLLWKIGPFLDENLQEFLFSQFHGEFVFSVRKNFTPPPKKKKKRNVCVCVCVCFFWCGEGRVGDIFDWKN